MGYFGKHISVARILFPLRLYGRLSVSLVIPLLGMSQRAAGEETGGKGGVC
jgi:hypothetical protein